jgi:hypothetical protein
MYYNSQLQTRVNLIQMNPSSWNSLSCFISWSERAGNKRSSRFCSCSLIASPTWVPFSPAFCCRNHTVHQQKCCFYTWLGKVIKGPPDPPGPPRCDPTLPDNTLTTYTGIVWVKWTAMQSNSILGNMVRFTHLGIARYSTKKSTSLTKVAQVIYNLLNFVRHNGY